MGFCDDLLGMFAVLSLIASCVLAKPTMPPKAKTPKQDKSKTDKLKSDKSKAPSDDPKKLKAANAVKVRHILCEKQSKGSTSELLN